LIQLEINEHDESVHFNAGLDGNHAGLVTGQFRRASG
jgi:hypothetical protein